MKTIGILTLILLSIPIISKADSWTRTSGPDGVVAYSTIANDSEIFVTSSSGILRSIDEGKHWNITTPWVSNVMLVFCGNAIIAGTGQISYDRGYTWTTNNNVFPDKVRSFYCYDNLLFAAVDNHGLYISSDCGQTWLPSQTSPSTEINSMIIHSGKLIAATRNGAFVSSDTGHTWDTLPLPLLDFTRITDYNSWIAISTFDRELYVSSDDGESWEMSDLSGLPLGCLGSIYFYGSDLYLCKQFYPFKSTDFGKTWSPVTIDNQNPFIVDFFKIKNNLAASTWGMGLYLSDSTQSEWSPINNGTGHSGVTCIYGTSSRIFAGLGGRLWASDDDGDSWFESGIGITTPYVISMNKCGYLLFAGTTEGLYRSDNNGDSWSKVSVPVYSVNHITSNENLIAFTDGGERVYVSSNGGSGWVKRFIDDPMASVCGIQIINNDIYASTFYSGVYVSHDLGVSWIKIDNNFTLNSIKFMASCNGEIFVVADNRVYKYNPITRTWVPADNGLPLSNLYSIYTNGTKLFAGTFFTGVYLSEDQGQSWNSISDGLPVNSSPLFLAFNSKNMFSDIGNDVVWRYSIENIMLSDKTVKNNFSPELNISPNPSVNEITVTFDQTGGNSISIIIEDMNGKNIKNLYSGQVKKGENAMRFDCAFLSRGSYILTLNDGLKKTSKIFIVE